MEKLTLSIHDREKIAWIKAFAKAHKTSISRLFESYIDALVAFDGKKIVLSKNLRTLRRPGKRPDQKQIEQHLILRRHRHSTFKEKRA